MEKEKCRGDAVAVLTLLERVESMGDERGEDETLVQAACTHSREKFHYALSPATARHVLSVLPDDIRRAFRERPFVFLKACWIYDHAPGFLAYDKSDESARESLVTDICRRLLREVAAGRGGAVASRPAGPMWRVRQTTFWGRDDFDPTRLLTRCAAMNLEGLEIGVDFHPFNPARLLPEEFSPAMRRQLRDVAATLNLAIDIHSPIIGPYSPVPIPAGGSQNFYAPVAAMELQLETVDLAVDLGAEALVFHLVSSGCQEDMARLVRRAEGSDLRVTFENYCQTPELQSSAWFLARLDEILELLPPDVAARNFGVTLDSGHMNIEGEDPIVAAVEVGEWCRSRGDVYLRMHATDNYGLLLFSPPAFSADVHGSVSGRGIDNPLVIQVLRSLGVPVRVVAEQIKPLTEADLQAIHTAQTCDLPLDYEGYAARGVERLASIELGAFLKVETIRSKPHQFIAGIAGVQALREYMVFRTIQDKKHLSVDEAMRISTEFMQMGEVLRNELTTYIDDLLMPVQAESGIIEKSQLDLICQNINGALFWTMSSDLMSQIFADDATYSAGMAVCRQGESGDRMYFVKTGSAGVFINGDRVATLNAGEIFGEITLFYNICRSATVVAECDGTVVGALDRKGLEHLLKESDHGAFDMVFRLYQTLPARLRNMNDKYSAAIQTLEMMRGDSRKAIADVDEMARASFDMGPEMLVRLSPGEARQMYEEVIEYDEGATIFRKGDEADGLYLVLKGSLAIFSQHDASDNGREILLSELQEGEFFGEISLIDGKQRSATARTLSPCRIGFMSRDGFDRFINSGTSLALRFMSHVCLLLFRRILRLDGVYSRVKAEIQAGS
ncbi:MAG: cyclic nucleotide-binding domain-containing protein [Lentisphaeria bacterium]|nr:cyclic nucleotide-binding domain-containing protein [Lentisphaeria bacterium]